MKLNKILVCTFCLFCCFNVYDIQAKIYFDKDGKQVVKEKGVFDVCIFLDPEGVDVLRTHNFPVKPASVVWTMMEAIAQKEAIIASSVLVDNIKTLAVNRERFDPIKQKLVTLLHEDNQKAALSALNSLKKDFITYKTANREFFVFIPIKKYKDTIKDVSVLGLNSKMLTKLSHDQFARQVREIDPELIAYKEGWRGSLVLEEKLRKEFEKEKYKINLPVLNNIFLEKIEKRIVLMGHGFYKEKIAGFDFEQYVTFLKRLQDVNCVFLYLLSCYSGGMSQIKAQTALKKEHKKLFKKNLPSFIIIAGSMADIVARAEEVDFEGLFMSLHEFLFATITSRQIKGVIKGEEREKVRVRDWIKEKKWISKKPFGKIVKHVTRDLIENTPSIYIPYISKEGFFFDALEIDKKVKIVTLPVLLQYELEAFLVKDGIGEKEVKKHREELKKIKTKEEFKAYMKKRKQKVKEREAYFKKFAKDPTMKKGIIKERIQRAKIVIGPKVKYLLIYPRIIDVPIEVQGGTIRLISIVPGNCSHYLKGLTYTNPPDTSVTNILKELVGFGKFAQDSNKAFFVNTLGFVYPKKQKLSFFDKTLHQDVFVMNNVALYSFFPMEDLIQGGFVKNFEGKSYQFRFDEAGHWLRPDEESFQKTIDDLLGYTSPEREVLKQARRGIVSEARFKKVIERNIKQEVMKIVRDVIEKNLVEQKKASKLIQDGKIEDAIANFKAHEDFVKLYDRVNELMKKSVSQDISAIFEAMKYIRHLVENIRRIWKTVEDFEKPLSYNFKVAMLDWQESEMLKNYKAKYENKKKLIKDKKIKRKIEELIKKIKQNIASIVKGLYHAEDLERLKAAL